MLGCTRSSVRVGALAWDERCESVALSAVRAWEERCERAVRAWDERCERVRALALDERCWLCARVRGSEADLPPCPERG